MPSASAKGTNAMAKASGPEAPQAVDVGRNDAHSRGRRVHEAVDEVIRLEEVDHDVGDRRYPGKIWYGDHAHDERERGKAAL